MRLLILTQKVDKNDPILGFFHSWLAQFARHFEKVSVICLEKGDYNLPDNVEVHSLGKERGFNKARKLLTFYFLLYKLRHDHDAVFVHMNPEYVVMGGLLWRLWKKHIVLWYTHRAINWKLRKAYALSHAVATAAEESLNVKGDKTHIIGHGINTHIFKKREQTSHTSELSLLHVGRITPIKHLEVLIGALDLLHKDGIPSRVILVGEPVSKEDREYKKDLEHRIETHGLVDYVSFVGSRTQNEVAQYLENSTLSVNLAPTGGIDKSVLEALAVGVPTFVCNRAFDAIYGTLWSDFSFPEGDSVALAQQIKGFIDSSPQQQMVAIDALSSKVHSSYSVEAIVGKLAILLDMNGDS